MPAAFVKRSSFGVLLSGNGLVLGKSHRAFLFESDFRPLPFGQHWPMLPPHVQSEVMNPAIPAGEMILGIQKRSSFALVFRAQAVLLRVTVSSE